MQPHQQPSLFVFIWTKTLTSLTRVTTNDKITMKTILFSSFSLLIAGGNSVHGFVVSPVARQGKASLLPRDRATNAALQAVGGLNIELPDFGELFERIQEVSPLARQAIKGESKGLAAVDDKEDGALRWKRLEKNLKGPVSQIDKIDQYDGKSVPLLRFRSSLKGPMVDDKSILGQLFGRYIIDLDERKKWDAQIDQVYEIQSSVDDSSNNEIGLDQYGDCSRLGVGYGLTQKAMGITPREQLFLYGLQKFSDGSSLLWGTELDDPKHNHLLPGAKRHTRAKSHLFSATLIPTGDDTFDIEYVLQLAIGGSVPTWLTTPVMIDTVKNLFRVAEKEFSKGLDNFLGAFLNDDNQDPNQQLSTALLMTP